ncbi:MAG: heme lyase CcmF/NrfE family subunit [Candidatus Accumulibacter sp.]|jgi:cytochrome c-type biogenesis protein CcmF|nr:heme lyase CcmF/NrfE family subunit [Accumulibacter sp.]
MIPEFGRFALALALCVALAQSVAAWRFPRITRAAAFAQTLCIAVAFLCLICALVSNDFSVDYVVRHSNTRLPPVYRAAAAWSGHEGSLLFWVFALSLWTAAFRAFSKPFSDEAADRIASVLGAISAGLLLMLIFIFNPFERLSSEIIEGAGLNPLLQDPGLILHPPMLFMGYSGLALPFAFAVEALLSGRPDIAWARGSRPWTIAAWVFLTLGIALGSFWAYYELGWGGWWFWDPVENASFMPWLAATALIHALPVAEKRGAFRAWCLFLGIIAFGLSLIGAFLVRSGVLISVHSFFNAPQRGASLLVFLTFVIGVSLALFAWRAPRLSPGGRFGLVSRETFLLAGSASLAVACASILLGTLYPLLIDALDLGKLSVGPPYFETVFAPLMIPALFLAGFAACWKRASPGAPGSMMPRRAAFFALASGLVSPAVFGVWKPLPALGLTLAAWLALTCVPAIWRAKRPRRESAFRGLSGISGMSVAHLGVAVFIAGVTLSNGYPEEKNIRIAAGETVRLADYAFRLNAIRREDGPNYQAFIADIDLIRDGQMQRKLFPEKRFYPASGLTMTETAIDFGRNLHVALGEPAGQTFSESVWALRISIKPFVNWIWGGCALMALGGLVSLFRRHSGEDSGNAGNSPPESTSLERGA